MDTTLRDLGDVRRSSDKLKPSAAMRFQYSIRLALLITLAASIALAWYANHERQRQRRLQAMAQIERDAGFVIFRNEQGGIPIDITDDVRRRDRVESIYLANSTLDKRIMNLLPALSEAKFLSFNSSEFADRHVTCLDGLKNLNALQLNGTAITRAGLDHIVTRHRLHQLTLNDTTIDDTSIDVIIRCKSLRQLHIRNTRISVEGIKRIQSELPACRLET